MTTRATMPSRKEMSPANAAPWPKFPTQLIQSAALAMARTWKAKFEGIRTGAKGIRTGAKGAFVFER
jgi:hypothetical protein